MTNLGPNADLIGKPGSRAHIQTPALVLDLDAITRNIARMAEFAKANGVNLRPHAKTHKSVEIAKRQVEAGAVGVSTATIGEAEIMVNAGLPGVLVTTPAVGPGKIARLLAAARKAPDLMIVADDPANVRAVAEAATAAGQTINMVVALDVGIGRIGARTPQTAFTVAQEIIASPVLKCAGIHAYAGSFQHIADFAERKAKVEEQNTRVSELATMMTAAGLTPPMISGAGTGTHAIDGTLGLYSELQVGSYLFNDVEYDAIHMAADGRNPFDSSLFVQTTVVNTAHPGYVTTDGGIKRFAMGGAVPRVVAGAPEGTIYDFLGDEHGKLVFSNPDATMPLGSVVSCLTPHCDPTVNLYDVYHVVQGDTLVDIWPIDARGAI